MNWPVSHSEEKQSALYPKSDFRSDALASTATFGKMINAYNTEIHSTAWPVQYAQTNRTVQYTIAQMHLYITHVS